MLECWLLYTHLNVLDSQRKDTHEALFLIFLKQYNDWLFLNLPLASTLSPPIFLNYYLLKPIFHPGHPGPRPAALLGHDPQLLHVGCLSVSLCYTSQAWNFSFPVMVPCSLSVSFPRNPRSPTSVSLLSALFTNQSQLGTGTLRNLQADSCVILGTELT